MSGMIVTRRIRGFTLIEILVVLAIIAILVALILANFNTSRRKARDAQRQSDLTQIQLSIEQYYDDYSLYPTCVATGGDPSNTGFLSGCPSATYNLCIGTTVNHYGLLSALNTIPAYISSIPNDPLNAHSATGYEYVYARGLRKVSDTTYMCTGLTSDFVLATRLENPGISQTLCFDKTGSSGTCSPNPWGSTSNLNFLVGN